MKASKKEIGLLLGVFGVLIAVMAYALVFAPYRGEIVAMESELASLQEEEKELKTLVAGLEYYETEVDRLTEENDEILDQFPADIQPEDEIMYIVELEEAVDIEIPSISYGTSVVSDTEDAVEGEETESEDMAVHQLAMNVSYTSSYQGLKDAITYTNEHLNRMVIDTLSVSYDASTGKVFGNMTFNLYYLTGTDKEYTGPDVDEGDLGVNNIFGTIQ